MTTPETELRSPVAKPAATWPTFEQACATQGVAMKRNRLTTLQINLGKLCNQTCLHCHVDAGPNKVKENMNRETAERLVSLAKATPSLTTVDLTGGAPEMNPYFRYLVKEFRSIGLEVLDRCNLTVLLLPDQADLGSFLADNQVHIVASLPCYSMANVDEQRGDGVFEQSIRALRLLNSFGYGKLGSDLNLDLVYNPVGAHLPPPQKQLEQDYKKKLKDDFDLDFNQLFTITNMPIKRFLFDLRRQGRFEEYMNLLVQSFNPAAAENVMCKNLVSIGWDGRIFDCDFNQMLNLRAPIPAHTIWDLEALTELEHQTIRLADHCYGCTAGAGSSCTGALQS